MLVGHVGERESGGAEAQGGHDAGVVRPLAVAHEHFWHIHATGLPGSHVRGSAPTAARGSAALEPDLPAVPAAHASGHPRERCRVSRGWQRLMC